MKREVIANKAVWRGPKMYIMNVWDDEGRKLSEPELKFVYKFLKYFDF